MSPPLVPPADTNAQLPYDTILIAITTYVFEAEISSAHAWKRAKIALFDALGCAFETLTESPEACALIGPVVPGTVVSCGCKLPGTAWQLDPVKGAFDLGSLIRYLDHSDAFPGAEWGHPSDNIGAILAVADWLSRTAAATGSPPLLMKTVLRAIIQAYEIQGCFQIRNAFNKIGLDHTILVRVASTAVVSHLLGCSRPQTLAALSHAFIDAGPLRAYRQSPNAGPRKGWAAGDACMRAVHLALLAKKGQPGAPTVLSDPKWGLYASLMRGNEFHLPKPFRSWVVENVFFKIHAAEGHAASAVEAAPALAQLLRSRRFDQPLEQAIRHVRVRTQKQAMIIIDKQGPLSNAADRDHCMQYMVAVVLLQGSMITSADYNDDSPWASDSRVDVLRQKIEMVEDEQFTADYHSDQRRTAANALIVTLATGEQFDEILVEYPTGHPWRDDTLALVKEKFEGAVKSRFGGEKSRKILHLADMGFEEFGEIEVCRFVDDIASGGEGEKSALAGEGQCLPAEDSPPRLNRKNDNSLRSATNVQTDGVHVKFLETNEISSGNVPSDEGTTNLSSAGVEDYQKPTKNQGCENLIPSQQEKYEAEKTPPKDSDGEIYFAASQPGGSPHPSPYVSHDLPFPEACIKHVIQSFHATRVYILASGSLSNQTTALPRLHAAISQRSGDETVVGIRRGVKPHTYYSDILAIVKEAQDANVNCFVTLGGGSLADAAKVVALALANNVTTMAELETLYFDSPTLRDPLLPATIPIICIPTTLSAGEYTPIAGATNDITHHKHSFQHLSMGPRLIILDPALTTTTPLHVWLSTGIRAVDHCVEAICSIASSPAGDASAETGLRRLLPNLLRTKTHPHALEPRLECQLGALDAMRAPLARVPMGASHGIGHQLGPLGGETSCVLLPAVCQFNRRANGDQQRRIADLMWSEPPVAEVLRAAGFAPRGEAASTPGAGAEKGDLGDLLDAVFRALGMPRTLREVGVTRDMWGALAEGSLRDRWCRTNPVELARAQHVVRILDLCSGDSR